MFKKNYLRFPALVLNVLKESIRALFDPSNNLRYPSIHFCYAKRLRTSGGGISQTGNLNVIGYLLLICATSIITASEIELSVSGAQQAHMPITIIVVDTADSELNEIAQIIKKDLEFTAQFDVNITQCDAQLAQKQLPKTMKKLS